MPTELKGSRSTSHPKTAKEIVHALGRDLSTLNWDINLTRNMPPILPGEVGVKTFAQTLRGNLFRNLADAIEVVHSGEKKIRKGKRFPSKQEAAIFKTHSRILADMAYVIGENSQLLDTRVALPEGIYRGNNTRVGELVLTFYELILEKLQSSFDGTYPANQRAFRLTQIPKFIASPLIQRVNADPNAKVAQIIFMIP